MEISVSDHHCLTDNGDWVARSKTVSFPAVSTMERGQCVNGSPLLCARPESSRGQIPCRLWNKSFRWDLKLRLPVCIRMQKDDIRTLKILWSISELGGLRKELNHSAKHAQNNMWVCWRPENSAVQKRSMIIMSGCTKVINDNHIRAVQKWSMIIVLGLYKSDQ